MKVNGKTISGPRTATVVLPYGDGEDFIVFKFRALTSKDDYEAVMPRPQPPKILKPGNVEFFNYQDPDYRARLESWGSMKLDWEFLRSIAITEGLEWATVKMEEPATWANWRKEVEDSLGIMDFNRMFGGFLEANSLSDEKIEEARSRFLASQALVQSES